MSADLTDKGNGGRGRDCAQNDDDVALFQHLCCLENKEHAEYSRFLVETRDRNRRDV